MFRAARWRAMSDLKLHLPHSVIQNRWVLLENGRK